jgi:hypothetical protein
MSDTERFLRYRMEVVSRWPDSPHKWVVLEAIAMELAAMKRDEARRNL